MIIVVENIQLHLAIDKLNLQKECDLKAVSLLERNMNDTDIEFTDLQLTDGSGIENGKKHPLDILDLLW